jgi:hypothetical protein
VDHTDALIVIGLVVGGLILIGLAAALAALVADAWSR